MQLSDYCYFRTDGFWLPVGKDSQRSDFSRASSHSPELSKGVSGIPSDHRSLTLLIYSTAHGFHTRHTVTSNYKLEMAQRRGARFANITFHVIAT